MDYMQRRKKPISEINVVPYIDVMLVLLIIFMITAPLMTQGVKVDLPQARANAVESGKDGLGPIIVTVDHSGSYYINIGGDTEQKIAEEVLMARVAAAIRLKPGRQVLVRGDKNVNYGKVMTAMSLLQRAGVPSIGLITEPPTQ